MKTNKSNDYAIGIISAVGAYTMWGLLPIYWKLLYHVPAGEILAHRITWSFVFMVLVLTATGKLKSCWVELCQLIPQIKRLAGVILSSAFLTLNWFTYIWAVNNDHVVDASLGYYINPLVSVLLGIIFLKERLSFWQIISFVLATIGVLNMTLYLGVFPWVAIALAMSFGLYGLMKKLVNLGATVGITLETLVITPLALAFLIFVHQKNGGAPGQVSALTAALLMGSGAITAVPLILFASGANRLPLSTIGFLQYVAPTLMLVFGVFLYHEPFTTAHLTSFVLIWTALTIFTLAKTSFFIKLEPTNFKKLVLKHRS